MVAVTPDTPQVTEREMAAAGAEAFFAIMAAWGVTAEEDQRTLLGGVSRSTLHRWRRGRLGRVTRDTLERLSLVVGIYKALQILYQEPARADRWPTRPNRAFGGQAPLERMLGGSITDLAAVRAYLDAARG
ncbi:MAG: antitoxin Xre/MbcA/ParS toxin-binding domain-containing protein [Myxococcota bacterium]